MIPTWGAAFGANAIFNSAEYRVDLTHSGIPDKAAPGTTGTFTRATTSTWSNNDGYMVTGVAGEIGFPGARRVRNLLPSSEDLTSGWTATGGTLAAGSITESGATSGHYAQTTSMVIPATAIFIMQAEIKQSVGTRNIGIGTNSVGNAIFNPSTGVFVANDGATLDHGTGTQTADGYWPVWVKVQATTSNKPIISLYSGTTQSYAGDGASQVLVRKFQLEDVTAQTTQEAGEYVSVGVPSDWQGTELVTNGTFDTDTTWIKEAGWTIGGGVATHAAGVSATLYQGFNFVAGTTYVFSWDTVISAGAVSLRVGGAYLVPIDFKSASGTYTATYTAVTTATDLLGFVCDAPFAGTIDNFSVKPAYYHGSFVDGVKCYATDINGSPIPSSTLLGYQAEGARTNLFKYSNTFSSLGSNGPLTETQNAIGPNGASNYAWTLTDDSAGVTEDFYNDVTLTAAEYTQQIKVKKTTGAQTAYPVLHCTNYAGTLTARCTIDTTNGIATAWTAATGFTVQASSARCRSQNADFWLIELTFLGTAAAGWYVVLAPAGTTNPVQSTGILDVFAQGSHVFCDAQLELGAFASSYIATTTVAVTRNADVLTYSGGDIPNLKTLMAGFDYPAIAAAGTNFTLLSLQDASVVSNSMLLRINGTNLKADALVFTGGGLQVNEEHTNALASGSHKIALSVQTNNATSVIDGGDDKTDATVTAPTGLTQLVVGTYLVAAVSDQSAFCNIGPVYGWTRNLAQSELNAVTA